MDIGATLRAARERQGKTLRDIADATKISVPMIQALEENNVARLPGGVFARAYVRSCAREVGLDPDPIVAEFVTLCPSASQEPPLAGDTESGVGAWARVRAFGSTPSQALTTLAHIVAVIGLSLVFSISLGLGLQGSPFSGNIGLGVTGVLVALYVYLGFVRGKSP